MAATQQNEPPSADLARLEQGEPPAPRPPQPLIARHDDRRHSFGSMFDIMAQQEAGQRSGFALQQPVVAPPSSGQPPVYRASFFR